MATVSTAHNTPEKTIEETCSLLAMETVDEVPPQPSTAHQETHPDTSNGSVPKSNGSDGTKCEIIIGIPKLEDAHDAGGPNSDKCTLILTEGDSRKSLAMAGISVLEKNNTNFGVYPLKGKLLNVREASVKQVMENAEILNIKRILGLQHGKKYDSAKELRYGQVMIMADPDHDGSHFKGLVINFIHSFWPSLLKIPAFMFDFVTPIVKASDKRTNAVRSFYTIQEYESWKKEPKEHEDWSIKYYKGLDTNTSEEVQEYFRNMDAHKKEFRWSGESDSVAIEIAFSRKNVDRRKNWILQYNPDVYLPETEKLISYGDFVNKELIHFAMADLKRSIPSMIDGLKPEQRKILFSSLNRNLVKEVKVPELCGYVSADFGYHHGEASLAGTIIGMAQNFVGSNNINLLQPIGQFGTRNEGGKDRTQEQDRYLHTKLSPITRFIFTEDDDECLRQMNNDDLSFEPSWHTPVIPMVLVNGSEGIATGWRSYVPNYNPRDIISNLRKLLNEEPMEPMQPWYRGFKGSIEKKTDFAYTTTGVIKKVDSTTLLITELPIRKWTLDYKEFLEASMTGTGKPFIKNFRKHHNDVSVHFEVTLSEGNNFSTKELEKKLKLTSSISTANMYLFNEKGNFQKYNSPEEILKGFHVFRLERYELFREALLDELESDLTESRNIVLSVWDKVQKIIRLNQMKIEELTKDKRLSTIFLDKVEELWAELKAMERDVVEIRKSTARSLWMEDLATLEMKLDDIESEEATKEQTEKEATKEQTESRMRSYNISREKLKKLRDDLKATEREIDEFWNRTIAQTIPQMFERFKKSHEG